MDMVNVNGEHVNELLQAQAHVWNHIFNYINSMSLKCAVDLGIPDIIQNHGKPMTVTELVAALLTLNTAKACDIYHLMRISVHSGFFVKRKLGDDAQEDDYVLTNASRLLLKDDPFGLTSFLKLSLDPIFTKPWHLLGTWFQNVDRTPFDTAHEKSLWDYCSYDPKLGNLFNEGMASDARFITSVLIDKCKGTFVGSKSLVDVGGGTGTVAKAIADVFPHMECTVFDLPHVIDGLQGNGNLKFVGGDMFEAIPAADAVLLKWILHDWNDDKCLKILNRCKEAISCRDKEAGKVIIIDMVLMKNEKVNDEASNSIETQLFPDMLMIVMMGGREGKTKNGLSCFLLLDLVITILLLFLV